MSLKCQTCPGLVQRKGCRGQRKLRRATEILTKDTRPALQGPEDGSFIDPVRSTCVRGPLALLRSPVTALPCKPGLSAGPALAHRET